MYCPALLAAVGGHVGHQFPQVLRQGVPSFGVDAVADTRALDGSLDQPGVLQFPEVLAHRGLGEAQFIHEQAVHAGAFLDEVLQDGDARRMPEHFRQCGDAVLAVFGVVFLLGRDACSG